MRACFVLLTTLAIFGCEDQAVVGKGPVATKSNVGFELTAKTEIKSGPIRAYAETKYVYSQTINGRKRELWSLTRGDKYLRHWISPSGRVWVITGSMPGPGGGGGIWTRDPSANGAGPWGFHNVLAPEKRDGKLYARQSPDAIDLERIEAITLGNGGRTEQIRLPLKGGGEGRITLVAREGAGPVMLARSLEKGERDLLTEAIEASPYQTPRLSHPVPRSPLALWEYRDERTGQTKRILQTVQQSTYGDPFDGVLVPIQQERQIGLAPANVVRTPSARVLWFGFSKPGETDAANLTVMKFDGTVEKEVDLIKLGGYQNSSEVKSKMAYRDVRIRRGSEWIPIDDDESYGVNTPEELEIRDENARIVVKLGKTVEVSRLTGLSAIRPKELGWTSDHILSKRVFASPSGKFRLRERRIDNGAQPDGYVATFLGDAIDRDGKKIPIELWSGFRYDPVAQVKITDTGRAFILRFDRSKNEKGVEVIVSALFIHSADGNQMAGMDVLSDGWFKTPAEAKTGIRLDRMKVVSTGPIGQKTVDGVQVPSPVEEKITLPLEDGRVWNFRIGQRNGMPGEAVYWIGKQPTGP